MRTRWLWFVLALGACDSAPEADPCEIRLAEIEQRLRVAAASAEPSGAPPQIPLPASEAGRPLDGAAPLLVVSSEVLFAGRGVGGGEDVDRTAETLRGDLRSWANANDIGESDAFPIALWTAPDVLVDHLVRLLRHAPEQARFALLVRGPPVAAVTSEPQWVEPALRAQSGQPETQRRRLDEAWARATDGCERATAHLPQPAPLAPTGPPLGAPSLVDLMAGLRSCSCDDIDLAAIEAVATRALIASAGPVHRLAPTLRFGPATDAAPELEIHPDTTAEALVRRLDSRGPGVVWIRAD